MLLCEHENNQSSNADIIYAQESSFYYKVDSETGPFLPINKTIQLQKWLCMPKLGFAHTGCSHCHPACKEEIVAASSLDLPTWNEACWLTTEWPLFPFAIANICWADLWIILWHKALCFPLQAKLPPPFALYISPKADFNKGSVFIHKLSIIRWKCRVVRGALLLAFQTRQPNKNKSGPRASISRMLKCLSNSGNFWIVKHGPVFQFEIFTHANTGDGRDKLGLWLEVWVFLAIFFQKVFD